MAPGAGGADRSDQLAGCTTLRGRMAGAISPPLSRLFSDQVVREAETIVYLQE